MHIIFSDIYDESTNRVIDWLIRKGVNYIRYNGKSDKSFDFQNCEFSFLIGDDFKSIIKNSYKRIVLEKIESVWFRRPNKLLKDFYSINCFENELIPKNELDRWFKPHFEILKELVVESISKQKVLGSYTITGLNKPKTLEIAKKCGFEIPNTLITNSYDSLKEFFYANRNKIICKPLFESIMYFSKKKKVWIMEYTNLIEDINLIPTVFATSLFQQYIEKEYELRIVYLSGEVYAMCIFSQDNDKTKIDFRNYDLKRPNRMVPYLVDNKLKEKIKILMNEISLNMGSIDLLKSINGEIYFLEINPIGQYGFVSDSCNYGLDKKIAEFLVDEDIN